jgi:hypothetical protein
MFSYMLALLAKTKKSNVNNGKPKQSSKSCRVIGGVGLRCGVNSDPDKLVKNYYQTPSPRPPG